MSKSRLGKSKKSLIFIGFIIVIVKLVFNPNTPSTGGGGGQHPPTPHTIQTGAYHTIQTGAYPFSTKVVQLVSEIKTRVESSKSCNSASFDNGDNSLSGLIILHLINCGSINIGSFNIDIYIIPPYIDPNNDNNKLTSVITIFSNHQWKKASETEIEEIGNSNNSVPLKFLIDEMRTADWAQVPLQEATDVISVGTASYEGDNVLEEKRAGIRAGKLYQEVYSIIPRHKSKNLWLLNLGQYQRDKCKANADSNDQRPILIITVIEKPKNVNTEFVEKAIKEQLAKFDRTNVEHACYSNFSLSLVEKKRYTTGSN